MHIDIAIVQLNKRNENYDHILRVENYLHIIIWCFVIPLDVIKSVYFYSIY